MKIVQLLASPFLGGPERQVLGVARGMAPENRTSFISFYEGGRCRPFLAEAVRLGFDAISLRQNYPNLWRASDEIASLLRSLRADVLCCNGYKADVIGWLAARRAGIPVVSIAHGWTGATLRVRFNEMIDRLVMRCMDRIVAVSEAQAVKVRLGGVSLRCIKVIRNAVPPEAFTQGDPLARNELESLFDQRPAQIVGSAGRLSPEKGFEVLIEAAAIVNKRRPEIGFVVFGEGPSREKLMSRIEASGLRGRFVMPGFRGDLNRILPSLDVAALPSYTEGLPVALLEMMAAGVPPVATAVGGTPEVIEEGRSGYLIQPGHAPDMAERLLNLLQNNENRQAIGGAARDRVRQHFTIREQAEQYCRLFEGLIYPDQLAHEKRFVAGKRMRSWNCYPKTQTH